MPFDQQLEMKLALPDLTNTDVLIIKMKHVNQVKVTERKHEKEEIINQIREKKRIERERLALLKKPSSSSWDSRP